MDFSKYRLNDWNWVEIYRARMGEEAYNEYFEKVWKALDMLKENQYYDISKQVGDDSRDLFIKICCQYILTHNSYEFSNDYTRIIRREQFVLSSSGIKKGKAS